MYRSTVVALDPGGYGVGRMIDLTTAGWDAAERAGARIGHRLEVHASIGSTNDRARQLLDAGVPGGIVVVAEEQTAGRGRMGRTWASPAGVNLMASVGLRPALAADAAWGLGPAAALAARSACLAVAPVALKWPNDLVDVDGRKLGGLLVEVASEADRVRHAVLGFGINVNWATDAMPRELRTTATSLLALDGRSVDRAALLRRLLEALDDEIVALEAGRSPLSRYREACATLGREVTVETPSGSLEGRAVDLDDTGALVVETAAGAVAVASGEVIRVRPAVRS